MTAELPLVAIYADESCLGNGRAGDSRGGAAGVIEYRAAEREAITRRDYWISEPATTNNRMALRSAIEGFRAISRKGGHFRVVFTSDSQYLVKGMSDWVFGWMRRGWRRKLGAIENLELWQEAVDATHGHRVQWQWVRGHVGHPQNEYANDIAVRAAKAQDRSDGPVSSGFDDWWQARRLKSSLMTAPASFPAESDFQSVRPYPDVTRATLIT